MISIVVMQCYYNDERRLLCDDIEYGRTKFCCSAHAFLSFETTGSMREGPVTGRNHMRILCVQYYDNLVPSTGLKF